MRLSGAFGPLQGEAVTGSLTIQIKKTPTGSAIRFDYVVGGYMRFKVADIAPAVDKVLAEQMVGLANATRRIAPGRARRQAGRGKVRRRRGRNVQTGRYRCRGGRRGRSRRPPIRGLDAAVADLVKDEPKRDELRRRQEASLPRNWASAPKGPACSSVSTPFSARMRSASGCRGRARAPATASAPRLRRYRRDRLRAAGHRNRPR